VNTNDILKAVKENPKLAYDLCCLLENMKVAGPWMKVGTTKRPNWARYAPSGAPVARILPLPSGTVAWIVASDPAQPPRIRDYGESSSTEVARYAADIALEDAGFSVCR
jgi:hypothetical protein